ncbi:hypothetical protein PYCCODRAFT_1465016 [Trametes coccinea BRFM310]|uniref:Uncharacterized protein n=1 Tax=Trametes coccinea (strain BRFM310) TaxID=1353009 RepID=A0A1Y2IX42_TRAC3|nr:hypothetical protein PYCCODRAFT_1465016 [Trametes coccinea BRFM310]
MEQATFDFTASPLYFFLKKQTVEQPTNASRYSTMPTFKPPQSQACPACAAAEPEDVLNSQAWKTAVDVEQQVLDAEQNRPHTASLEMLAIVATVLSDKGQERCSSSPYNRLGSLLSRYIPSQTPSNPSFTYDMEQNGPSTATTSSGSRMITRSMTRAGLLGDIVNTAPVAGRRVGEPADNDSDSVSANLAPKSVAKRRQQGSASVNRQTETCETLPASLSFRTGDRVKVYMFRHGEWRWVPGKVASLRSFAPRLTASGSTSYPVLLDQQLPRIIMWFDPGEDRIQHSSA